MRYKVTHYYEGSVTVEVEAPSREEAEKAALEEADDQIRYNLSISETVTRPVR